MKHRFSIRRGPPRLIYFIDGVRIPKRTAVRAVVLHLILSRAADCSSAAAENDLAGLVISRSKRKGEEIEGLKTADGMIWSEQQWPKLKKRDQ